MSPPAWKCSRGASRYLTVPFAALAVSVLVILRGSFARRRARALSAQRRSSSPTSSSGVLAGPDWGATARGLVVPSLPLHAPHGILVVVATLGTTLAPWGLAFIQSYAVDKRLKVKDLGYERVDVVSGAVLIGVIGVFIVVRACATKQQGRMDAIHEASDAAVALRTARGQLRADPIWTPASLVRAFWRPRSCRYRPPTRWRSRLDRRCDLNDSSTHSPVFYGAYGAEHHVRSHLQLCSSRVRR